MWSSSISPTIPDAGHGFYKEGPMEMQLVEHADVIMLIIPMGIVASFQQFQPRCADVP